MNTVLKGALKEPLPSKALIEGDTGHGVPDPSESAAPTSEAPVPTQAAPTTSTAPEETGSTGTSSPTGSSTGSSTSPSTGAGLPLPGGQGGQGGQGGTRTQSSTPGQGQPNG